MNPVKRILGDRWSMNEEDEKEDRFRYDENGRYYECRFCDEEFDSLKERNHHEKLCEWTEKRNTK